MEKQTDEVVEVIQKHHTFYCDKCNCLLGDTTEAEDGYYEDFGRYERSVVIPDKGYYGIRLNLCNKCKEKMDNEIEQALLKLGFKRL